MNEQKPYRKPVPERTRARRGASTLLRGTEVNGQRKRSSNVLTSSEDVVMEAVKLGYKIADEQILKGQDFARRLRGASLRSEAGDIGNLLDHGLQLARQFAILLVEMSETTAQAPAIAKAWAKSVNEGQAAPEQHARQTSGKGAATRAPLAHSVPVEVRSSRRTLVSLVLYEKPTRPPVVYPLHPKGKPDAPPLRGIEFRTLESPHHYALSVSVPPEDEQPSGTYLGYVIGEADEPIGTVTVTIEQAQH